MLGLLLGSVELPVGAPLGPVEVPMVVLDPEPPVPIVVSVLPEGDAPLVEVPVDADPRFISELPEVCAETASGKDTVAARHPTITICLSHRVIDVSLQLLVFASRISIRPGPRKKTPPVPRVAAPAEGRGCVERPARWVAASRAVATPDRECRPLALRCPDGATTPTREREIAQIQIFVRSDSRSHGSQPNR